MPSPLGGGYSHDFKQQVVDRFTGYFEASATLTTAAAGAARDFGVATSTVLTWAQSQERMPRPTWGEIRRLRAANAHLSARLRELEDR